MATPEQKTIEDVAAFLDIQTEQSVKTLIVLAEPDEAGNQGLVALVLRGDHELNELKAEKHPLVDSPLEMATEADIVAAIATNLATVPPLVSTRT